MGRIAAVLFDADGVVQRPPPRWRDALGAMCGREDEAEAFLTSVFAAERPCLDGSRDFRSALAGVLTEWQSSVGVDEALKLWTHIETDQEILSVVRSVRATDVIVALATNQQPYRAAFMTEDLGYGEHFDHLLYSCELGCAKPGAEYFQAALERVSVAAADTLFLDDHQINVEAARACGLNAERFDVAEGATRLTALLRGYGVAISPGTVPS